MKHLFTFPEVLRPALLLSAFFFSGWLGAQHITSAEDLDPDCNTLKLRVMTFFPYGSATTCPPLVSSSLTLANGMATVSLFYDNSAPYPAFMCTAIDTVTFLLFPGASSVLVKAYAANSYTTVAGTPTTMANCFVTGLGQQGIASAAFHIFPNPAAGQIVVLAGGRNPIGTIEVFDLHGSLAMTLEGGGPLDVSRLQEGLYFVCVTLNGSRQVQKLIRQD